MIKVEAKQRRIEASFLDGLFKDLGHSLCEGLASRMEDGARDVLRWLMSRLVLNLIAIGVSIIGIVFLLVAGIEGLKAASVPASVAYLIAGIVGLGTGLLTLHLKK